MAVRWEWTDKIGHFDINENDYHYSYSLYEGSNCPLVCLAEWKNGDGEDVWQFSWFVSDKTHAKNWTPEEYWKKYATATIDPSKVHSKNDLRIITDFLTKQCKSLTLQQE